eukprot:PhM_4_TR18986/c0_g1_i1/m.83011/K06689/UBE2D, UBC4, UBC5; ubiquitin-conjugating enzyme E2 D
MALRRLSREMVAIQSNPPSNMTASPVGDDLFKWSATIVGPEESPYSGGLFPLSIDFPTDYPLKPPTVKFTTPVYHPSVNENGGICLDLLKDAWVPSTTVPQVLEAVVGLLLDPRGNDKPLMANIMEHAQSDWEGFCATAKEWTSKHAGGK